MNRVLQYREWAVGAPLQRGVECVWALETGASPATLPVRPDGCIDILYSPTGRLEVVGAMTRERRFEVAAKTRFAGVRFRPGMAAGFLRIPAQKITDRTIPLESLWGRGARTLEAQLADAMSAEECCRRLAGGLMAPEWECGPTERALAAITAAHGNVDLAGVIRDTGITERQVRRRLLEVSGLSPKKLCRVLRFRHACALGQRGLPWSRVAVEAGYFDQAHLIRDFREFANGTPVSVFSKTSVGRAS